MGSIATYKSIFASLCWYWQELLPIGLWFPLGWWVVDPFLYNQCYRGLVFPEKDLCCSLLWLLLLLLLLLLLFVNLYFIHIFSTLLIFQNRLCQQRHIDNHKFIKSSQRVAWLDLGKEMMESTDLGVLPYRGPQGRGSPWSGVRPDIAGIQQTSSVWLDHN